MTEQEKIEVLRTLRVIAKGATPDVLRNVLEIIRGLIGGLALNLHLLEYPVRYDQYTQESRVDKIHAIKALREAGSKIGRPLGLKEAKELAEAHPCAVFTNLSSYSVEIAAAVLTKNGCKVEIRG